EMAGKAHGANDGGSPHAHYDRRRILAFDPLLHLMGMTVNLVGFAKQEAADIQEVNSHVHQNIVLQILQPRFIAENGVAGNKKNMSAEGNSDLPRVKDF